MSITTTFVEDIRGNCDICLTSECGPAGVRIDGTPVAIGRACVERLAAVLPQATSVDASVPTAIEPLGFDSEGGYTDPALRLEGDSGLTPEQAAAVTGATVAAIESESKSEPPTPIEAPPSARHTQRARTQTPSRRKPVAAAA